MSRLLGPGILDIAYSPFQHLHSVLHSEFLRDSVRAPTLFDHGITPVVTLTMTSALGFTALAYHTTLNPGLTVAGAVSDQERNLYVAAAAVAFGLAPYTQFLMGCVNAELSRRATASEKAGTKELVETWGRHNLLRGCMLLGFAGLGTCIVIVMLSESILHDSKNQAKETSIM
ncbi:hypothetical protein E8E11_010204 [Didymella keratinophila]|nr:hypothetical protein E8E11_010204 [Didymella keratinophila]